jgi:hypothetical protein
MKTDVTKKEIKGIDKIFCPEQKEADTHIKISAKS